MDAKNEAIKFNKNYLKSVAKEIVKREIERIIDSGENYNFTERKTVSVLKAHDIFIKRLSVVYLDRDAIGATGSLLKYVWLKNEVLVVHQMEIIQSIQSKLHKGDDELAIHLRDRIEWHDEITTMMALM